MKIKQHIIDHIKSKAPEVDAITQWTGEWLSHKVEVSRFVAHKDRHRHAAWGKSLQKKLGKEFTVTLTMSGYQARKSRFDSDRTMHFVVMAFKKKKT